MQVIAAALSDNCAQLATIHVHSTSDIVADWLYGVPQITTWDYKTQRKLKTISTDKRCLTKHHYITLVNNQPVVYWQVSTTTDVTSYKEDKISEGVVHAVSLTGRLQHKRTLPGVYSKVWRGSGFLANNISLMGWMLGGVSNRALHVINIVSRKTIGKASIHGTDINCFDMSQDGTHIAVGCRNGEVHHLASVDPEKLKSKSQSSAELIHSITMDLTTVDLGK